MIDKDKLLRDLTAKATDSDMESVLDSVYAVAARADKLVDLMDDAESNHGGLIGGVTLRAKNELRLALSKWK